MEMQIILMFMDKKRRALNDLLRIMDTGEKDKSLEHISLHGIRLIIYNISPGYFP